MLFKIKKHANTQAKEAQFRKLCQLCSPNFTKEDILSSEIDWPIVWTLALRHRVVPVMADRIKQLDLEVSSNIAILITTNVQQNLYKGMKQAAELVRLTLLFEEHNIPFIVFKGIAIIKLMGLDLHQRHHGDIDILLADAKDLWRADEALRSIGYKRRTLPLSLSLNATQMQHFKKYEKDVVYYHPKLSINLELHFKLFLSDKLVPIAPKELYEERSHIEINRTIIPILNIADHQAYLLAHGAVSGWFRLKWLCDVPLISINGEAYSDNKFIERSQKLDITRITSLGICLANKLLSMSATPQALQHRDSQKSIHRNITIAQNNLSKQDYINKGITNKIVYWIVSTFIYMPSLKQHYSYKIDFYKSSSTRTADWELLPLPESLFFLYYLLRPFLWLKRQF